MKREYPVLYAKASTVIAAPILFITTVVYIQRAINQPAAEIFPLTMTAFGVTAALSGICFTMAPLTTNESTARYAGEKFLHSSLLLIQSLIIIYAKDAIINLPFIIDHGLAKKIVAVIFSSIVSLVSSTAGLTWYWGFSELNRELWRNWERRIANINMTGDKEKT